MASQWGRDLVCEVCGQEYHELRTGHTFASIKRLMRRGPNSRDWIYKRRHGVLGFWHGIRRQARAAAQADAAAAQLADEDVREILAAEPHPTLHMANRGATLLGWCEYVLEHGGAAGKVRVAKAIAAAVKRAKDSEREMERDALRAEINAGTR